MCLLVRKYFISYIIQKQQGIYPVTHWRMLQAILKDRDQIKGHQLTK